MAATISIGSSDDAIWMIKNALYEDLVNLACMQYGDDSEVVKELEQSVFVNGIALEIIEDTDLAMRTQKVLVNVAQRIANGELTPDSVGGVEDAYSRDVRKAFAELVSLLEGWEK